MGRNTQLGVIRYRAPRRVDSPLLNGFCRVGAGPTVFGADVRPLSSWTDLSCQRIKLVGKRHLVSADDRELEFRFPLQAQQYSTRTRHNPGVGITTFERDIRPFTTGRKAWAFSNSTAGADASATIYSLMLTPAAPAGSNRIPTCSMS
jgi:hypothetical protein